MPQMAPLMWLTLFALFSGLMLLSMIKIYFSKMKINNQTEPIKYNKKMNSMNYMNWKW